MERKALIKAVVSVLVGLEKGARFVATQALVKNLAKCKGKKERGLAVEIVRAFGKSKEYREIYRHLITTSAWRDFSKAFTKELMG